MQANKQKVQVTFIRCGMTKSAKEGRYVGAIDEPLLDESKENLRRRANDGFYPEAARVYSSTQKRCLETSFIIYPKQPVILTPELRAFDYGEYAGKTYADLLEEETFASSSRRVNAMSYPGGEDVYVFQARVTAAFQKTLLEVKKTNVNHIAIITHKETIMPILRRTLIPRTNYGDYPLEPSHGITAEYDLNTGTGHISNFF